MCDCFSSVRQLQSRLEYARFEKGRWKQVTQVDWKAIKDEDVKRQFKILSKLGTAALPEDRLEKVRRWPVPDQPIALGCHTL